MMNVFGVLFGNYNRMSVWYQMKKGHSENGKFSHGVKKLFKLSQTWHRVSPVNVECNTKRIFAIACLGKS